MAESIKVEDETNKHQILITNPTEELLFRGSFTSPISVYLELINPSDVIVCFKMKTTMPKKYSVTPNMGVLACKSSTKIKITLQPCEYNEDEKHKHKFILQSMILELATPTEDVDWDTLWKRTSADVLMNSKFQCAFEIEHNDEAPVSSSPKEIANSPEDIANADAISKIDLTDLGSESRDIDDEISRLREELIRTQQENMKLRKVDLVVDSSEAELQIRDASEEIIRLRAELSCTQQENIQLKEDILKSGLRRLVRPEEFPSTSDYSAESNRAEDHEYENDRTTNVTSPIVYFTSGLVIGSLTMLLKKFFF